MSEHIVLCFVLGRKYVSLSDSELLLHVAHYTRNQEEISEDNRIVKQKNVFMTCNKEAWSCKKELKRYLNDTQPSHHQRDPMRPHGEKIKSQSF